jgi:hypothetical protein
VLSDFQQVVVQPPRRPITHTFGTLLFVKGTPSRRDRGVIKIIWNELLVHCYESPGRDSDQIRESYIHFRVWAIHSNYVGLLQWMVDSFMEGLDAVYGQGTPHCA